MSVLMILFQLEVIASELLPDSHDLRAAIEVPSPARGFTHTIT
jgi:hypothetical protein